MSVELVKGNYPAKPSKTAVLFSQICLVFRLALLRKWLHLPLLILPYAFTTIISLLIAFVWFQLPNDPSSATAVFRVFTLQALFLTSSSNLGLFTIFQEDRLLRRPRSASLVSGNATVWMSAAALWYGRLLGELPIRMGCSLLASIIIYPIVGLRPGLPYFLLYQCAFFLQTVGNTSFGMLASALFARPEVASRMATSLNAFNYIFSGIIYTKDQATWILLWLRFLSVSFYVDQVLTWVQFVGRTYPNSAITGDEILQQTGWLKIPLSVALVGMVLLIILFNILGPILLWATTTTNTTTTTTNTTNSTSRALSHNPS